MSHLVLLFLVCVAEKMIPQKVTELFIIGRKLSNSIAFIM